MEHRVDRQRGYFVGAAARDTRKLERNDFTANSLFVFGLLIAIVVVVLHYALEESNMHRGWHHWLIVTMGTAPAIAAAMGGYAEKMALSAQAKRYGWMSALFTRARKQLGSILDGQDPSEDKVRIARNIIRELGREALEENGDWVLVHRERTLELPKR